MNLQTSFRSTELNRNQPSSVLAIMVKLVGAAAGDFTLLEVKRDQEDYNSRVSKFI